MILHQSQLTLIRGLPGSGKTTLAKMLLKAAEANGVDAIHVEADMFFVNQDGEYVYDHRLLKPAHAWCFDQFRRNIFFRVVIVSNTFTTQREVNKYFSYCIPNSIPIQVYECKGSFGNVHNVPEETLLKMEKRWENIWIPELWDRMKSKRKRDLRAGYTSETID